MAKSTREDVLPQFMRDIAKHEMTVLLDHALHRHLLFRRPDRGSYWFEIITWPGRLAIAGDMGDYTFSRLRDMFEFFRVKPLGDGSIHINPSYWAEKLTTDERGGGHKRFSLDRFHALIVSRFREWRRDRGLHSSPGMKREVREQLLCHFDNGHQAYQAAYDFEHDGQNPFAEIWETNVEEYTFHFLWCLYAIAWGISRYDEAKDQILNEHIYRRLPPIVMSASDVGAANAGVSHGS